MVESNKQEEDEGSIIKRGRVKKDGKLFFKSSLKA
jgi:hypothetical protein